MAETDPTVVAAAAARVADNVERVIVGKRDRIEQLLVALVCRGHVLLEDVPGTGKTMLARAVARSLDLEFRRLQCTPDLLPTDVTGVSVFDQGRAEFTFRPGPVFTNVLLADEINRATPRTQSALLEAMGERQVSVDGVTRPLPDPFLVLATQNPVEYEGTFPLPEAQLDRFLIRIGLGYPEPDEEAEMARRVADRHPIDTLEPVVDAPALLAGEDALTGIFFDPSLEDYVVHLVRATRVHPDVALGASPRATIALHRTARALALLRGRTYVAPDDVKEMAPLVLAHRIVLEPEAELRGRSPLDVVGDVLAAQEVPIEAAG